jgi:hypothetical protein
MELSQPVYRRCQNHGASDTTPGITNISLVISVACLFVINAAGMRCVSSAGWKRDIKNNFRRYLNIQNLPFTYIQSLSVTCVYRSDTVKNCVNLLWLTGKPDGGVITYVIGPVLLGGTITLENINLDVNELSCLDKIEQAQRFEEVHRQIDELQRAASGDPCFREWAEQQRQYITDMQQMIFEG